MLDEYVRWALKPPFGGHYGGALCTDPHGRALHNIALPAGQESVKLPMENFWWVSCLPYIKQH